MANYDVEPNFGFPDKRKVAKVTGTGNAPNLATPGNYASISTKRTRLATINAGYYTTRRLDMLTENDMDYALRVADDNAGIC